MSISDLLSHPFASKTARYAIASVAAYVLVTLCMWTLVDHLSIPEKIAYAVTLAAVYPLSYFLNIRFVFHSKNTKRARLRYIGYLAANYLLTNLIFWMLSNLRIYYLYSSVLAMLILVPARFLVQNLLFTQKQ